MEIGGGDKQTNRDRMHQMAVEGTYNRMMNNDQVIFTEQKLVNTQGKLTIQQNSIPPQYDAILGVTTPFTFLMFSISR